MSMGHMKGGRERRTLNQVTAPRVTEGDDKVMRLKEELLTGIPNNVTLEHITTKMPRITFHSLSSVSRVWKQVIEDRLIYDARVRCRSAETVVVINHTQSDGATNAISLYSVRDQVCYQLPRIPRVDSGIPWPSQCVTLDGKVYILGGSKDRCTDSPGCMTEHKQQGRKEVCVLDLAGQRHWKQCARMQEARHNCGCGVKNGKIYVFGGMLLDTHVLGAEVYDPNMNASSAIQPMTSLACNFEAATVGEELYVYGGRVGTRSTYGVKAYDPVKDEWRTISNDFGTRTSGAVFTAQEKFHSLTSSKVYEMTLEMTQGQGFTHFRSVKCGVVAGQLQFQPWMMNL